MATHEPRCAYWVLYKCERCGKLGLDRNALERTECPAGEDR